MPYKSKAQEKFLHAKKPKIAAQWDHEIKGKFQQVEKSKKGWGVGLTTAAVGGAVANQVPPVKIKRRKKGTVKKAYTPTSTDPNFNHEAAQKTFDLIMKMDDDTAAMFCHVVASDLLEQEVEQNRDTLQRHLDEVVEKQLGDLKHAVARTVAKGVNVDDHLYALDAIVEEIRKDDIPNFQFERKIRRDPGSGRFQTKISQTKTTKPLNAKTAAAVGIKGTDKKEYESLSREKKAKYQNEYAQLSRFLDTVTAATNGDADVMLHYKDDTTGETWVDHHGGGKPPIPALLDPNTTLVAAEARPNTLSVGGAAFSLASAMGGGTHMSDSRVSTINDLHTNYGANNKFATAWTGAGSDQPGNSNARLYARTATLGDIAGSVGTPGSKVQLAGKMAEIVGQYGPQAEQVLGPSARKTAYRYRGTEKAPDQRLVSMYSRAVEQNKKYGPVDPWGEREENKIRAIRGVKNPIGSETAVRAQGTYQRKPEPPTPKGIAQSVAEAEARRARAPEWGEREMGRRAVAQYLTERLPRKDYYKLHLEAGNTPPSEGVIINANGQIASQASGYGDDHYLPFNLKNLKDLKGGEYIRSRSVGGLTSEDIYTGLISGARRVTVVSRSGTFTMEFQPDFRGGRRHNDKARRMTRRYEHILDAVQSEQVERQDIPPRWKKIIEEEVRGEYGPGASQRMIRAEVDARQKEFKENPQIDGRDLDRAEAEISRFEAQAEMGVVSREDVSQYRKQIMGELRDMKEIRFRLNGVGYAAALDSLEEQFPYYIHAASQPKEEHLQEFEIDRGYVEPARNRPTSAKAGWHGTQRGESGKYSAATADYQRGLAGTPEIKNRPRGFQAPAAEASTSTTSRPGTLSEREQKKDEVEEKFQEVQAKIKTRDAATELHMAARAVSPPAGATPPEWWGYDADRFRDYVQDSTNLAKFQSFMETHSNTYSQLNPSAWQKYHNAIGTTGAQKYTKENAHNFPNHPYTFKGEGEAFRPNAPAGVVQAQKTKIDGDHVGLVSGKPLSQLTEGEMKEEVNAIRTVMEIKQGMAPGTSPDDLAAMMTGHFSASPARVSLLFRDGPEKQLRAVHQMRYLNRNPGTGGAPPQAPPAAGGGAAPAGGTPAPAAPAAPAAPVAQAAPAAPAAKPSDSERHAELLERKKAVAEVRDKYVQAAERMAKGAEANNDQDRADKLRVFAYDMKHIPAGDMAEVRNVLNVFDAESPKLAVEVAGEIGPRKGKLVPQ